MKKIAFLVSRFPDKTKTFEVNHIMNALNFGYEISIFPQNTQELKDSSQPEIIEHYGLMDKVMQPQSLSLRKMAIKHYIQRAAKIDPLPFQVAKPVSIWNRWDSFSCVS